MGDGAFSNVYNALDLQTGGKGAVRVIREYEVIISQDGDKHPNPKFKKKPRVTEVLYFLLSPLCVRAMGLIVVFT